MYIVFGIVQAAFTLFALGWLVPLAANPRRAYQHRVKHDVAMGRVERWLHYARWIAIFIGLLTIFYHASGALISWMPADWGSVDEDGEWQALAPSIKGIMALAASGCLLTVFESHIQAAAKHVVEEQALIELIDAINQPVWREELADDLRRRLLGKAKIALKNEGRSFLDGQGVEDYRNDLMNRLHG